MSQVSKTPVTNENDFGTLVLSIKSGEVLYVGDAVISIENGCSRSKVTIRAPKKTPVLRGKLKHAG